MLCKQDEVRRVLYIIEVKLLAKTNFDCTERKNLKPKNKKNKIFLVFDGGKDRTETIRIFVLHQKKSNTTVRSGSAHRRKRKKPCVTRVNSFLIIFVVCLHALGLLPNTLVFC